MTILVTGGAGYIGSHMVKLLLERNESVVTLDNLTGGHRDAVLGGEFIHGDLADRELLDTIFREHSITTVMHFASFIQVAESVSAPGKYYRNNVANTFNLLDAMAAHEVKQLVFSSSAAIFSEPGETPIAEQHPICPLTPYGASKAMVERALMDYDRAHGIKYVSLRYFNAAGADPSGLLGEHHDPETHLIPLVLQAASGLRDSVTVFGRDYDTLDGTCIRDYIHVSDLCEAHLLAMQKLQRDGASAEYNLGNGNGYSVQQVIETARRVTGTKIKVVDGSRRDGDPARLVADSTLALKELGWKPQHADLETIIAHAWQYHRTDQ
jgi:UDP-glucose 4-epimerase